jgi:hypothetical protein
VTASSAVTPDTARAAVNDLLVAAADDAWASRPGPGAPDEVTFLRSIFHVAVRGLDGALAPALAGFGWRSETQGIFVHGRPFLAFDKARSPGGCEVGDLLIVVHHQVSVPGADGVLEAGNALLLQGKIGTLPLTLGSGGEARQWELYARWPQFWWRHKFLYRDDGRRHLRRSRPHPGAQYLAIEPRAPQGARFAVALPDAPYAAGRTRSVSFADAIVDTVLRVCGLGFSDHATARGRIGWDRVIWDLLGSWDASGPVMQRVRYHGFPAYRVGAAVPEVLAEMAGAAFEHAQEAWSAVPELRGADGDEADGVEWDGPGPGPISVVFVTVGPQADRRAD